MASDSSHRLAAAAPELQRILTRVGETPPAFAVSHIRCETVWVPMRDGTRLATDLYLPPKHPAPAIAIRTPYGRANDRFVGAFLSFARRGYVVIAQDCRGTGESEPESFDYYVHESEDGFDLVEWISRQSWFGGFLGACGSSYIGQTQWCMGMHPSMTTFVPEVSGLGIVPPSTANLYIYISASARTLGKGKGKVSVHYTEMERFFETETMAGGYYNEPLQPSLPDAVLARFAHLRTLPVIEARRWLWKRYCGLSGAQRAGFVKQALGIEHITSVALRSMTEIFGQNTSIDAHTIPNADPSELCSLIQAPPLMITGWYDWGLNDALATWSLLRREGQESVRSRTRLLITPSAHNTPGYYEGIQTHAELQHNHRTVNNVELLLSWYAAVQGGTVDSWPVVIYYLMGKNEWRVATDWPPPEARPRVFYLASQGRLIEDPAHHPSGSDSYVYDPEHPTPTAGGSIVSYMYPPGSVDVSEVQRRPDVLTYTTEPLEEDLDVVGGISVELYVSSSAADTDFCARLSDVFPDGRAIQLQSGMLRARYRQQEPELLEPGRIYRMEIDLWATANRFFAGHRLRVDISSADFPHFDRNNNRGGEPGRPIPARQTLHFGPEHPSCLRVRVVGRP